MARSTHSKAALRGLVYRDPRSIRPGVPQRQKDSLQRIASLTPDVLTSQGKLILLVDLDETLLHATQGADAVRLHDAVERTGSHNIWIKARPYVEELLATLALCYEMVACAYNTFANVKAMLSVIDPNEQYFGDRILSKSLFVGEDPSPKCQLLDYFPKNVRGMVVILGAGKKTLMGYPVSDWDDYVKVQSLKIVRFKVFHSWRKAFHEDCHLASLASVPDFKFDVGEDDDYLKIAKNLLPTIAQEAYAKGGFNPTDLKRSILRQRKRARRHITTWKEMEKYDQSVKEPVFEDTLEALKDLDRAYLKKHRKLILLCDLDNTLMECNQDHMAKHVARQHFHGICGDYSMQIRPGVPEFLEKCYDKFEMIVVTAASLNYASEVVAVLDPDKKYFKNRIISSTEQEEMGEKYNKSLIMIELPEDACDMVVMLDDRVDVWHGYNVLQLKPYKFFAGSEQAFPDEFYQNFGENSLKKYFEDNYDDFLLTTVYKEWLEPLYNSCFFNVKAMTCKYKEIARQSMREQAARDGEEISFSSSDDSTSEEEEDEDQDDSDDDDDDDDQGSAEDEHSTTWDELDSTSEDDESDDGIPAKRRRVETDEDSDSDTDDY